VCLLLPLQTQQIEFSPDGSLIACACSDGSMRVWRLSSLHEHTGSVTNLFGKNVARADPTEGAPGHIPLDPVALVCSCLPVDITDCGRASG
jgi:WD40 repeat protein